MESGGFLCLFSFYLFVSVAHWHRQVYWLADISFLEGDCILFLPNCCLSVCLNTPGRPIQSQPRKELDKGSSNKVDNLSYILAGNIK